MLSPDNIFLFSYFCIGVLCAAVIHWTDKRHNYPGICNGEWFLFIAIWPAILIAWAIVEIGYKRGWDDEKDRE